MNDTEVDDVFLHPAGIVKGSSEGDFEGRAGLLVFDVSVHDLVLVTAAQIGHTQGELRAGGRIIAARSPNRFPEEMHGEVRAATEMLAILPVRSGIKLAGHQPWRPATHMGDSGAFLPARYLGDHVEVHVGIDEARQATLSSTHARFRMPCPYTGEMTLFVDALELTAIDGEAVTRKGESGALVTTRNGVPIGIVVCGIGSLSFAAPLWPVLRDRLPEWELLGSGRIDVFNQRAEEERIVPEAISSGRPAAGLKQDLEKMEKLVRSGDTDAIRERASEISTAYFGV
ncbi:hypothetical protein [Hyphomonas sp.]|uniref:hypothetical protein n=1 Tax=Hyphomonas sp. TaxID=87 RepID=UPI0025C2D44D|nr:hypothetical protein [Hyphomonas sp.]